MFCRTLATEILLTILALLKRRQNSYLIVDGDDEQPFESLDFAEVNWGWRDCLLSSDSKPYFIEKTSRKPKNCQQTVGISPEVSLGPKSLVRGNLKLISAVRLFQFQFRVLNICLSWTLACSLAN